MFADGACTNNGSPGARAGTGVAYRNHDSSQLSIPITDGEDNSPSRSNQRAELFAAKLSLTVLAEAAEINTQETSSKPKDESAGWIIATDSENVVKGMTEWFPKWKVCSLSLVVSYQVSDQVCRKTTGARLEGPDQLILTSFLLSTAR